MGEDNSSGDRSREPANLIGVPVVHGAYGRRVLETISWERNSDDFVFDCQFLVQAAALGFRIGDIPTPSRYFPEASSIDFRRSTRYGLASVYTVARYHFDRARLWRCDLFEPK